MRHRTARFAKILSAAAVAAALSVSASAAAGLGGLTHAFKRAPAAAFIASSTPTLAPFAHVVLCMQSPGECQSTGPRNAVVELAPAKRALLLSVNRRVNGAIRPRYDRGGPLGDSWSVAPREGDCEDYALTKRHTLIAYGWPSSALRLAVVRTPSGEGHAVLVVRTSEGDLVLDNRTRAVRSWTRTGLRWVKIQSAENPKTWLAL